MKLIFQYSNFFLIFNIFIFINSNNNSNEFNKSNHNIEIKVLLGEIKTSNDPKWIISSSNGLILKDINGKKKLINSLIEIKKENGNFNLNNKKIGIKSFIIEPVQGHLKFNNKEYQGSFSVIKEKDSLLFVNTIELEDYIFSVLNTESWPGWPLEVNKAFAIASRSYVISIYEECKNKKVHYHIRNTNKHQTYYGIHNSNHLRQATQETTGIILGYKKKPILAMFDACCGGIIPSEILGINFIKAPYLARKAACTFCQTCKLYSWKVEYEKEEFEKILKFQFPRLQNLQVINILKDKSGLTQRIEIKDKKTKYSLTGKKFYSLFNKIRSFCFHTNKTNEKVIINGYGWGHHLGLCQWGAREMVKQGWNYKSILKFYYPGTSFMKIKKINN